VWGGGGGGEGAWSLLIYCLYVRWVRQRQKRTVLIIFENKEFFCLSVLSTEWGLSTHPSPLPSLADTEDRVGMAAGHEGQQ
jgi:hypothetical protein